MSTAKKRKAFYEWYHSPKGKRYRDRTAVKRRKQQLRRWALNPEKYILATRRWFQSDAGRKHMRKYRRRNRERQNELRDSWFRKNKEFRKASGRLFRAVNSGLIKKLPCEKCGSSKDVGGTHDSYGIKLDVTWLCRGCRMARTRRMPSLVERAVALARSV